MSSVSVTNQSGAVDTKGWLEIGDFMEFVLEAFAKSVTIRPVEIGLHFGFADLSVPRRDCKWLSGYYVSGTFNAMHYS